MFVSASGALRYKDVVEVIDAARGAGVEKVGIVTDGMACGGPPAPATEDRLRNRERLGHGRHTRQGRF